MVLVMAVTVAAVAMVGGGQARALDLTGVLLYAADQNGNPTGPKWRTTSGKEGYPLALSRSNPYAVRSFLLVNGDNDEIDIPLQPGFDYVHTLLWQFDERAFPPNLVINLFFDGNNLSPRISALVPYSAGSLFSGSTRHHRLLDSTCKRSITLPVLASLTERSRCTWGLRSTCRRRVGRSSGP